MVYYILRPRVPGKLLGLAKCELFKIVVVTLQKDVLNIYFLKIHNTTLMSPIPSEMSADNSVNCITAVSSECGELIHL